MVFIGNGMLYFSSDQFTRQTNQTSFIHVQLKTLVPAVTPVIMESRPFHGLIWIQPGRRLTSVQYLLIFFVYLFTIGEWFRNPALNAPFFATVFSNFQESWLEFNLMTAIWELRTGWGGQPQVSILSEVPSLRSMKSWRAWTTRSFMEMLVLGVSWIRRFAWLVMRCWVLFKELLV